MQFTHLAALLPEIEAAHNEFERSLETIKGGDDIDAIATRYNEVLLKAVEAIYQDTKHVNSRDSIYQVFAKIPEGGLTYFSNDPYTRLKKVVETNSIRHL